MSGPFVPQTEKDYLKMARIYVYVFLFEMSIRSVFKILCGWVEKSI